MKRCIIWCLAMLMATSMAYAQDAVNHDYEFVTLEGEVIQHGSTVVLNKLVTDEDPETGEVMNMVVADFTVKNMSAGEGKALRIANTITRIDNGTFSTCALGTCIPGKTTVGEFYSTSAALALGSTAGNLQTEWYADAFGQCIVDMQIEVGVKVGLFDFEREEYGPRITVVFAYDNPDGVEDVDVKHGILGVVGRYTIDGCRIDMPRKGVNILRMANGTTRKVVVK